MDMWFTLFLTAVFLALAAGGRTVYRVYAWMCRKLSELAGLPELQGPEAIKTEPVAMVLTGFTLCTMFILLIMAYTAMAMRVSMSIGSVLAVGLMILVFDNIFIMVGYWFSRHAELEKLSRQLMRQKERTEMSYYAALEEQYNSQRVLIHDIRKHLAAIRDMSGSSDGEAVARYVKELERLPALQHRVRICGNPTLDVVLCRYKEICEGKGIAFSADVREGSVDGLQQSDITALFGNLLENAVEGAAQDAPEAPPAQAPYLELRVEGSSPGGVVVIHLVNTCPEPPQPDGSGGWLSRKPREEGLEHGLGLRSVRATVKRYGGTMRQYYDGTAEAFHTVIYLK